MESLLQLAPQKPTYKFADPSFVSPGETRQAVTERAINQQISQLSKLSISAVTNGSIINTQYPLAKRIATYQIGTPAGLLSILLSSSVTNPIDGAAGVVVAIGNSDLIEISQSGILLLQHFATTNTSGPSNSISGTAYDGKSVEYLSSGMSVSLYAFGPNDATVLIAGGVSFKFAIIG